MKTNILLRQVSIDEKTRALIEKKLSKLDKFFHDETSASVTLSKQRDNERLELTISQHGRIFRSEVTAESFTHAIDTAVSVIERQIRRNKTRLEKQLRESAFIKAASRAEEEIIEDIPEEGDFDIRRKDFTIVSMSVEEAILQMNLLEHDFFVFIDSATDCVSVVYKRHDDKYGVIVTHR